MSTPARIRYHWQLDVYKLSVEAATRIFGLTKLFPKEETYSLTDQIRRSSRSVSGQIAEGWRRRRYVAAFVNKLNEAEGEAAETLVWLVYSVLSGYLPAKDGRQLQRDYDVIIGKLVSMINNPEPWLLHGANRSQAL